MIPSVYLTFKVWHLQEIFKQIIAVLQLKLLDKNKTHIKDVYDLWTQVKLLISYF